jgi:hypothetical protein
MFDGIDIFFGYDWIFAQGRPAAILMQTVCHDLARRLLPNGIFWNGAVWRIGWHLGFARFCEDEQQQHCAYTAG